LTLLQGLLFWRG